ncbi:hypothetical protein N184_27395 [Sinorhizobium sp. GL28]|nr:hypothetical protein N184_27395 [Sinorhizobium sp. GL28]
MREVDDWSAVLGSNGSPRFARERIRKLPDQRAVATRWWKLGALLIDDLTMVLHQPVARVADKPFETARPGGCGQASQDRPRINADKLGYVQKAPNERAAGGRAADRFQSAKFVN